MQTGIWACTEELIISQIPQFTSVLLFPNVQQNPARLYLQQDVFVRANITSSIDWLQFGSVQCKEELGLFQ